MPTETEKRRAIEAPTTLPDNATIEDAIERLCFIAKIEEGFRQSESGRLVPHEEVKKQFLTLTTADEDTGNRQLAGG